MVINLTVHAVLVEVIQEVGLLTLVNAENRRFLKVQLYFSRTSINISQVNAKSSINTSHKKPPGKHVLRIEEGPDDPHKLHGRTHVWGSD